MSDIPRYTPEENFRRIKMDNETSYILLEGEEDIPIYESIVRAYLCTTSCCHSDFVPVHGGGKERIITFTEEYSGANFLTILDMDFDVNISFSDQRIIILNKYSIENYLFSTNVLIPLLSNVLSSSEKDIDGWFTEKFNLWKDHIYQESSSLLQALFYYQRTITTDREKWSNSFITSDNSWEIDQNKVSNLINTIYDNQIPWDEISSKFAINPLDSNRLLQYFPGKLLVVSLYRFIKEKVNNLPGKNLGSTINNEKSFFKFASPYILRDIELSSILNPMFAFVTLVEN